MSLLVSEIINAYCSQIKTEAEGLHFFAILIGAIFAMAFI